MTTGEFRASLAATRSVGTPLICIRTADPASAMAHMSATLNGKAKATPLLCYDFIAGLVGRNELGTQAAHLVAKDPQMSPPEMLSASTQLPEDSILFFLNPQLLWTQIDVIQGIWNLRDTFKAGGQMLILITTIGATLPPELSHDVMSFDEPLPSPDDIKQIIKETFDAATIPQPTIDMEEQTVDALIGLASFPAETALSMSLSKTGLNIKQCWERKCQTIEQTRGLSVWRGPETFADVRGCDSLVEYLTAMMHGEEAPRGVVFMDEANDALAGAGTDSSGTKGDLVGTLLQHMTNRNSDGIMLIGPPGTGKTLIGKATAAVANRIMIEFDLAGMQHGIVGSSGENMRSALAVVDATTQGRALWIATANSLSNFPPQLKRRFRDGTFFVDIPDADGREALWALFEKRYNVSGPRPADDNWTGAEIENCCRKSYRLKMTLKESAKFIVPISVSGAEQLEALRRQASGKFLSASKPGVYTYNDVKTPALVSVKRKFQEV